MLRAHDLKLGLQTQMSDVGIGPAWQTGVAIEEGTPHLNFFSSKTNYAKQFSWDEMRWENVSLPS